MKSTRESLWSVEPADRPREKLQRLGPGGLSDAELVVLVLGSGMPGVNVLDSASSLLGQAGGVQELMAMSARELMALMGVGVATAGRVVAVSELWRRANDPPPGVQIERPGDLVEAVRAFRLLRIRRADGNGGVGIGGGREEYVVVADSELRLRMIVPLAHAEEEPTHTRVERVLHEVLYRGGAAFAFARVGSQTAGDDTELRITRDVLKLASATVGLRYLATVLIADDSWVALD